MQLQKKKEKKRTSAAFPIAEDGRLLIQAEVQHVKGVILSRPNGCGKQGLAKWRLGASDTRFPSDPPVPAHHKSDRSFVVGFLTPGMPAYLGTTASNPLPELRLAPDKDDGTKAKVSSVRFAPTQTVEGSSSHVHFDEKLHDSVVMVSQEKDGNFLVKVGFLKILHKYEITFVLPFVQLLGKNVCAAPLANLHLRVISIAPVSEGQISLCC
ncbi:hypothetical protein JD844_026035 [Phrynosoma platyrhinos]|uniref:Adipose-secreted signaling protein n=1 Tax=Phrynosoma platyrhinos TaxID=52577 RepID=A0ABQ7SEE7_PHRPL|nr:hypothetical protein JD844_026035 [Phrynosoma platyrhinos]